MNRKIFFFAIISLLVVFGIKTYFKINRSSVLGQSSQTINATVQMSVCGNNIVEGGEDCDNSELGGQTCQSIGFGAGSLSCDISCSLDTSSCLTPTPSLSSNTFSIPAAPTCNDSSPGVLIPFLYKAEAKDLNSIAIFLTKAEDPVDHYVLEYGTKSNIYDFGSSNIGGRETSSFTVEALSPSTTYYFRVRAGNGCAVGIWSNEIAATTKPSTFMNGNINHAINQDYTTPSYYPVSSPTEEIPQFTHEQIAQPSLEHNSSFGKFIIMLLILLFLVVLIFAFRRKKHSEESV
jgi:hypothetical protein